MQTGSVQRIAALTFALAVLGFVVLRASGCTPKRAPETSAEKAPSAGVGATTPPAAASPSPEATPSATEAAGPGTAASASPSVTPGSSIATPVPQPAPPPASAKPRFMPATKAGPIFEPPGPQQQQQQNAP